MRDYKYEFDSRVAFIKDLVAKSGARGIVYGNSGGKDSALVGALCKAACEDTVGVIMPCASKRNYGEDAADAKTLADAFGIKTVTADLTPAKEAILAAVAWTGAKMNAAADVNVAPRLRMTTLYSIAAAEGRLVAGTGNRSETYVGYFTKWGDGAADFNPICDLTVTEVYEFLAYLKAPAFILEKAPSAGLFDGQTDESEMGVTYAEIDAVINGGSVAPEKAAIIERMHERSRHKIDGVKRFKPYAD